MQHCSSKQIGEGQNCRAMRMGEHARLTHFPMPVARRRGPVWMPGPQSNVVNGDLNREDALLVPETAGSMTYAQDIAYCVMKVLFPWPQLPFLGCLMLCGPEMVLKSCATAPCTLIDRTPISAPHAVLRNSNSGALFFPCTRVCA